MNEKEEVANTVETMDENPNVIYVKDRPFKALFKQAAIVLVSGFVILFVVGFTVGLLGLRVPYIDGDAIGNQWNSLTGGDRGTSEWNELEPNK